MAKPSKSNLRFIKDPVLDSLLHSIRRSLLHRSEIYIF
jgi:hypothetical protein